MKKVSVVIPTLQKKLEILNNLIKMLDSDNFVTEIIVIDNSTKGYIYESNKVKVIVPKENLFVNPSWNLGVKESKEDIVALLNDDITIPENFCKNVVSQMNEKMGVVGFHRDYIINIPEIMPTPASTEIALENATGRCGFFGVAMFFYKSSYIEIPEDIKIFWGDDWLYYQNKKRKRENYFITKQEIYHYGSLSSTDKVINPYSEKDSKLYRKYTRKWWQQIFNIESVYKGFRLTILGLELLYHYDKKH
ncbi:glycosyltransferase [bacterium]|nr:glycosyltransferase [bacterium]